MFILQLRANYLISIAILLGYISQAQNHITGRVTHNGEPVEHVLVYLHSTTQSGYTNKQGEFSLKRIESSGSLIIQHLSYERQVIDISPSSVPSVLEVRLREKQNSLNEVLITAPKMSKEDWQYFYKWFKKELIGEGQFAKDVTITNPEALRFKYNATSKTFTATASEPLQIEQPRLGYTIDFDLVDFRVSDTITYVKSYSHYRPLSGSKREQRQWVKHRAKAYFGSKAHFLSAVHRQNTQEQGYYVHQMIKKRNPKHPTDQQIQKAVNYIKKQTKALSIRPIINPQTALDSALYVLQMKKEPKYIDEVLQSDIPASAYTRIRNDTTYLHIKHHLMVVYSKEKEEPAFLQWTNGQKDRPLMHQTSLLYPRREGIVLTPDGRLKDPHDLIFDGYFSFEKLAYALPLDFTIPEQ